MTFKFLTLYKCLNCGQNFAEWQDHKSGENPKCRHCNTAQPVVEMGTLIAKAAGNKTELKTAPSHFKKEEI